MTGLIVLGLTLVIGGLALIVAAGRPMRSRIRHPRTVAVATILARCAVEATSSLREARS